MIGFMNNTKKPGRPYLVAGVTKVKTLLKTQRIKFTFSHVPRENNSVADWLCRVALKAKRDVGIQECAPRLRLGDAPPAYTEVYSAETILELCEAVGGKEVCKSALKTSLGQKEERGYAKCPKCDHPCLDDPNLPLNPKRTC